MIRPSPTIAPLGRERVEDCARILADSFADDPVYGHLIPDPRRRRQALRAFLAMPVRDALAFDTAWVALYESDVVGVAVWLPPGAFPWSTWRKLRVAPGFLTVLRAAPRALPGLMALGGAIDRLFPQDPVWYLEVVGVHPDAQGRGIGTHLLEPGLARADEEGLPCYLETPHPDNVRFYERLGFQLERAGVPLVSGGPTHWTMRRPPRPGKDA